MLIIYMIVFIYKMLILRLPFSSQTIIFMDHILLLSTQEFKAKESLIIIYKSALLKKKLLQASQNQNINGIWRSYHQ